MRITHKTDQLGCSKLRGTELRSGLHVAFCPWLFYSLLTVAPEKTLQKIQTQDLTGTDMIYARCRGRSPPELPSDSGQDLQNAASDQLQTLSPISALPKTYLTLRVHGCRTSHLECTQSIAPLA